MAEWLGRLLVNAVRPLVSVAGRPEIRQSIYVANHASHLDALLVLAALPREQRIRTRPVAKQEYWRANPLRRHLSSSIFRAVLIGGSLNPLEPAVAALAAGDSLILFPEGTRGNGKRLQALKGGVYHLARLFPQADVVPVWIHGSHRILPKGAMLPVPTRCRIVFGDRVPASDSEQDEFLAALREALEGLRSR